jgi:hypothetical protein
LLLFLVFSSAPYLRTFWPFCFALELLEYPWYHALEFSLNHESLKRKTRKKWSEYGGNNLTAKKKRNYRFGDEARPLGVWFVDRIARVEVCYHGLENDLTVHGRKPRSQLTEWSSQ